MLVRAGKREWRSGLLSACQKMAACAIILPALVGCSVERHVISSPGKSQVIRVESGDRFFMTLDEDAAAGGTWRATCNDPDVEVRVEHEPGKAEVLILVHRGYDGPSAVTFSLRRGSQKPTKTFTITLYKRTGDCAFWE